MRRLLSDRLFVSAVVVTGFVNAALFAYPSGATFLLQDVYGLSPQGYSYAFGLYSLGFMVFGFVSGRASQRWPEKGTLIAGLVLCAAGLAIRAGAAGHHRRTRSAAGGTVRVLLTAAASGSVARAGASRRPA